MTDQTKRVLVFIDDSLLPEGREVVTRRWSQLIPRLKDSEFDVSLATLRDPGALNDILDAQGFRVFHLGMRSMQSVPTALARLGSIIHRGQIDVLHSFEVIPAALGGLAGLGSPRTIRIYFRAHTSGGRRLTYASRVAARLNHVTFGASEAVARAAMADDRSPATKIRVVPHGVIRPRDVSVREVDALRRQLSISADRKVVVMVGRLRAEKGTQVLIDAIRKLWVDSADPPDLVVIGSGPEESALAESGPKSPDRFGTRVHLVGHQSDIAPWHALADVVVVPSLREAFGLAAAEALAAGRPVVASRVGGLPEVVSDGVTGFLVDVGDADGFARAIGLLLDDDLLRERMGRAGCAAYEERFTLEAQASRWRKAWRELIEARQR